jgi:DNA modification methylase
MEARRSMKAELVPIDSISLDPANLRRHPERNLSSIVASLKRFGQQRPILVDAAGIVRAGNGTLMAAKQLGYKEIEIVRSGLEGSEATAYAIADNRTAELAEWDDDALAETLSALQIEDEELFEATGFDATELDAMVLRDVEEDEVPEPPAEPITKPGDLWILGEHRVLCGDSTKAEDVARLMNGEKAQLIHADPPYGMGKEKDGVENDNLYADKLDAFQMAWWRAFRPHAEDNASAYIWGNAEGLWRLWFIGGLSLSERLTMRNEIVWDKGGGGFGVGSQSQRCYFPEERCLFFMLGEQGFNNNADNYWDGWEPIRVYLETEMNKCGGVKNWKTALGNQMGGHYFTKSQWCFPTEEAYKKLQAFAKGDAFKREHDELKREFYATRAYFDNTHDNMTDVWEFNRVTGEDRHGHATPKPVAMMARAIKSSTQESGLLVEPFLGSGSTLIAAEQLNRKCYGMEISPAYCDVIVKRWETLTGKKARLG